jgi:hypothetical protein
VEPFPPYAPELNPVDSVWSYVKYNLLANYTPLNLLELRQRITTEFCRLQKRPDLLKSFFKHTGLSLDPIDPDDSETYSACRGAMEYRNDDALNERRVAASAALSGEKRRITMQKPEPAQGAAL